MATLFNLTEIDGFDDVLLPIADQLQLTIGTAEELSHVPLTDLSNHIAVLSDERFDRATDREIVSQIQGLAEAGLTVLYVGLPRYEIWFRESLDEFGIKTLFRRQLDRDETEHWLMTTITDWRNAQDSSVMSPEPDANVPEKETQTPKAPLVAKKDARCPLAIVISGAPGCGTTFVGVNLATLLAQTGAVNYVECGIRPVITTWLSAEDSESEASMSTPLKPAIIKDNLAVYTRNPFGDETVNLRQVAEATSKWVDPVVMDLGLQDYLATMEHQFASNTIRVLVTTADIHRCRYLEQLPADIVVVNQSPKRLPLDEEEYRAFWPRAQVVFIPYEADQSAAIAQGVASLEVSNSVEKAMGLLQETLLGVGTDGNRVAG